MTITSLWQERNNRLLILLFSAPLLYMLYFYGGSAGVLHWFLSQGPTDALRVDYSRTMALVALGVLPLLIIILGFRERLGDYGLGLHEGRFNVLFTISGACIALAMTWLASRTNEFRAVYPEVRDAIGAPGLLLVPSLFYVLYYLGYEIFFRGFLLFGLCRRLGDWPAILITMLATSLVHVTRPAGEYVAAIVAGFVFGYVALRTRSIWGVFVVHLVAGISLDLFCALR